MAGDGGVTIIKKKKVSGGDGHHGGAWKVAYADFVTAMMAFFLLMWLLNATTESQRKGIADYFAPSIPVSRISGGGDGVLNGDSLMVHDTLTHDGSGGKAGAEESEEDDDIVPGANIGSELIDDRPLEQLEAELLARSGESDVEDSLLSHVVTRVTDEGLVIDIFAKEGTPLFAAGSNQPTPKMQAILEMVGGVVAIVKNEITIVGHTDATPFSSGENDNWRLSADRANATRRALDAAGVEAARFQEVAGAADRNLALPDLPEDPRNRRVTLTLLRSDR